MIMKWTGYIILMIICCLSMACERTIDVLRPSAAEENFEVRQKAVDGIKRYIQREFELFQSFEQLTQEEDVQAEDAVEAFLTLAMKAAEIFKEETGIEYPSPEIRFQLLSIQIQENPADVDAHLAFTDMQEDIDIHGEISVDILHVIDPLQMIDLIEEWVYLSLLHPDATEEALLVPFRESAKNGQTTFSFEVIAKAYADAFPEPEPPSAAN
jgi:hypothetical protein